MFSLTKISLSASKHLLWVNYDLVDLFPATGGCLLRKPTSFMATLSSWIWWETLSTADQLHKTKAHGGVQIMRIGNMFTQTLGNWLAKQYALVTTRHHLTAIFNQNQEKDMHQISLSLECIRFIRSRSLSSLHHWKMVKCDVEPGAFTYSLFTLGRHRTEVWRLSLLDFQFPRFKMDRWFM